jgi:archaellum biogenesis protein FlaJ (TadC family)
MASIIQNLPTDNIQDASFLVIFSMVLNFFHSGSTDIFSIALYAVQFLAALTAFILYVLSIRKMVKENKFNDNAKTNP